MKSGSFRCDRCRRAFSAVPGPGVECPDCAHKYVTWCDYAAFELGGTWRVLRHMPPTLPLALLLWWLIFFAPSTADARIGLADAAESRAAVVLHGDGHRPDDNECRHGCHHWLVYCAKKCHEVHNEKQPDLDACLNHCIGGWGKCVNRCEQRSEQ